MSPVKCRCWRLNWRLWIRPEGYYCSLMIDYSSGREETGRCYFHLTALLVIILSLSVLPRLMYMANIGIGQITWRTMTAMHQTNPSPRELVLGLFTYCNWTIFPHLDKCSKCRAEGFEGQAGFSEHQMQGHKWHQGLISHGILSICITSLTSLRLIVWVPLHTCQKPRSGRGTHKGQELNHIIVSDCQVCMDHIRTLTVPFHAMWWIV